MNIPMEIVNRLTRFDGLKGIFGYIGGWRCGQYFNQDTKEQSHNDLAIVKFNHFKRARFLGWTSNPKDGFNYSIRKGRKLSIINN